jgi:hypothetical protein
MLVTDLENQVASGHLPPIKAARNLMDAFDEALKRE